jgi:hypothetical protein
MSRIFTSLLLISFYSGCIPEREEYLLSPLNAGSNPYRTIPMKNDSLKSGIYVNGVFSSGSASDRGADHVTMFQGSLHRSNNFGVFQAYYGANLSLGSYYVEDYYSLNHNFNGGGGYPFLIDSSNHIPATHKFFGSYGISGGINIVATHQHVRIYRHSEWRILGLETSLQKEFGSYSDMRNKLPDSAANIIFRRHFSAYLGLYSEWLWTNHNKIAFGFKLAAGTDLNPGNNYSQYYAQSILPLYCFSITYHMSKDPFTVFIQTNFGTYADNIQFGISYRLGKKKIGFFN